ncbi:non-ribosomal peptide synthetase [Fluviispira vulneris]|uniref:non-ribosomal peptide synthetase n=1 Tax=Fluviispira vulneris TaxID=2763012 RepID=UPI0016443A9B|nr:non-ribosomal peptide synthetase [Fluviispira vulneris]
MNNTVELTPYHLLFYFEWKLNPTRTDYHIVIDQALEGELNVERLNRSLKRFISEFYLMNSHVEDSNGKYFWTNNTSIQELKYYENGCEANELKNFISKDFDLENGCLYRYILIKNDEKKFRFIFILQHILIDGSSLETLYNEISKYYNNENYSYAITVNEQEKNLQNISLYLKEKIKNNYEKYKNFWDKSLLNIEPIDLKFLKYSEPLKNKIKSDGINIQELFKIHEINFSFDKIFLEKIKNIISNYKITPYSFSNIIFAITIFKFTKTENFCIPYPVAIREGVDLIYGGNVNTCLLPFHLNNDLNIVDIIHKNKEFIHSLKTENIKQSYFPIYELELKDKGEILNLTFASTNLQNMTLSFENIKAQVGHNSFIALANDISFGYEEKYGELHFRVYFKCDKVSIELMNNFCKIYDNLYSQIINNLIESKKGKKLKNINDYYLIPYEGYYKYFDNVNSKNIENPDKRVITQCFEEQVLKTPHNIALVSNKDKLTYSELNLRANQLAHYLKDKYDIKADDLVALCLKRDEHMLISILAVLKAGAAYVPMDPEYPMDRIEYILEDTGTKLLLTNESQKELFFKESLQKVNIEFIDSKNLEYTLQKQNQGNLTTKIENHHLAYVIYTSGTTGKPKGVLIEHAGVVNLIVNQGNLIAEEFKENKYISVLWFANYVFDAHVWELSSSIFHGHCLYIVANEVRKDLHFLSEYVKEHQINYAVLPPSLLDKDNLLEIDLLTVAGDKFNKNILENYLNHHKKVINAYGPTETTVMSAYHQYHSPEEVNQIGNAIRNHKLYVLDNHLNLLPVGAIGELFIGGVGVARGYLNRPELTAEKFIVNPYQTEQEKLSNFNSRLYKTGDLVRLLPNGCFEYIGRNDTQVKIRGYRIELEEIESAILGFKNIKQAAAIAKALGESNSDHKSLICYYVSHEEINEKELKEYLSTCLPDYMLPNYFVYLKEIPLTVNGKLDKKALPDPTIRQEENFVAPRNELEKNICAIWESVLGLPKYSVGIKSDFFSLGGDSIISIQIVGRMRSQLGLVVSVKDIFKYKCIELLSEHIKNNSNSKDIEIKREEGILSGKVPLLPIQEWFFSQEFKVPEHWNHSFLIKTPLLDIEKLKNSICKLIEHHDAFRLGYTFENKTWKQSYLANISLPEIKYLDIGLLKEKEGTEIYNQKLIEIFTSWQSNFSLEKGFLFSFGYIEGFQDKTARIFVSMHHLIVDAVSWRIIVEDLQSIYAQKKLPKKGTSYRQWEEGLKKYSTFIDHEKDYWERNLIQIREFNLSLKSIYQKELLTDDNLNIAEFRLPENLTLKLLTECNKAYKTEINDILIAAFIAAIKKQTRLEHLAILLEGHGREEIDPSYDLTKTIGWFTSMYPVCFAANDELEKLVVNVKESLKQVPNKGIGYSALYSYVENELPCISFNYLGQFENESKVDYSSSNWQIVSENSGVSINPINRLKHTIAANGLIINGSLSFLIDTKLDKETTNQLALYFKDYLSSIILHLSDFKRCYLTRSDIGNIINHSYLDTLQKEKEVENIYLANSLQQGFVYHALNQGDIDDAYFVQIVWNYKNSLKPEYLHEAWNHAVSKYDVLRLRFAWDEELVQVIDKNGKIDWKYFDLTDIKESFKQKKYIKEFQEKDRKNKFQLDKGNLARVSLFKLSEDEYTCILSNHHAILDGWSLPVLLNYIHKTYLNLIDNKIIEIGYDPTYGEAQLYFNEHKDANINFWKNYVKEIENDIDLNGLLSQEAKKNLLSFNGYKHVKNPQQKEIICEENLYFELKKICQSRSVTINAMLQYVWHKVLSVYGNGLKTTIGTTVSGRNIPVKDIDSSVGLFINTLPLIVNHNANPEKKVIDCVIEIQDQINEINSRSIVNLSTLQKNGERLFDCIFVFENYPSDHSDDLSKRINTEIQMEEIFETLDYPFTMIVYETEKQLHCKLKFAGELFETNTIEKMLGLMKQLLMQIANDQNILVHSLKYLNEYEFEKILGERNSTSKPRLKQKNIVQLFEERVLNTPHNIALISEKNILTYSELNLRANQLAHYMKDKYAIKTDDLIALCLERDEHMLISILAVLKAGGAYVPMDPEYPMERIEYILEDTAAKVLLTNESHKELFHNKNLQKVNIELIDSKNLEYTLQKQNQGNLTTQIGSHHLAYVIYTSGTTGKPKGVMMGHESCSNRILYMIKENEMTVEDIFLFKTNLVFDVSFSDIFTTLLSGAKLIITQKIFDLDEIERLILSYNVTICHFVPSQFKLFLDEVKIDNLKSLNKVMFSGEEFDPRLIKKEFRSNRTFLNYYGPTETGEVTVKKYNSDFDFDLKNSSIGKVFDYSKIFVLDKNLIPLPINSVGELYITGVSVAHGYLNKLELTAERFITNSLQTTSEKKLNINSYLYKTGDLVRLLENGELEYIGRNDLQVKIRGFRIELSEIENAVLCFNGIKQAVVIVKNIGNDELNKVIICYYISEIQIDIKELTQFLSTKLPDYMIPGFFMQLSTLPLTINGKLDKRALPDVNLKSINEFEAPQSEMEKNIASIWEEVLCLEKGLVGIKSDFFSLGGNSITAIKLLNRINKELDLNISLKDFLASKNIKNIVQELLLKRGNNIKIEKSVFKNTEEQILSFAQERLWFIDKFENGLNSYNIPMLYKLSANTNEQSLLLSLQEIISRHEVLRSVIKDSVEGNAYQEALFDNGKFFQLCRIECDSKKNFEEKLKEKINHTFNLNLDIPISGCIYILKDDNGTREKFLNITIHHIAFDGWSTEVFLNELLSYYDYFEKNEQSKKISPLDLQYKDFARWQKNYLQGQILEQEMKFWKDKLSGIEALDLHLDKQRPLHIDYKGQNVFFELDRQLSDDLRIVSKNLDLSKYSLFLSSYYLMLSCISGQKDIVVGSPIANRHFPKIGEIIGYFVNTIVLRAKIDPELCLVDFIKAVGKEVIEAQQHQDLPFEKLVVEISPERDPSKHPIFQVMFEMNAFQENVKDNKYLNFIEKTSECDEIINQMYSPAKFDLSLFLNEELDKISGCFNYSESLFHKETIKNYTSLFIQILKEISLLKNNYLSSDFKLKHLNYLPADQLTYIYSNQSALNKNYFKEQNIIQCFEEQVIKTPHNIALVSENNKLTYSELNLRANQLAHYIKDKYAIKADDLIALCLKRDEHMLISILAVLKAGGAYVPMDPEYPMERIEYILNDTGSKVLLTNESLKELFLNKNLQNVKIEFIDGENGEFTLQKQNQSNLTTKIDSHHLAYVIYTSGTTGRPKGVLIEHASVVNLIVNQGNLIAEEFKENKYISVLWFANYVFDAHVWELSSSIFHGHCLYIVANEVRKDLHLLSEFVKKNQINYAVLLPFLLDKDTVLEIDLLTVGGDKFNKNILENYLNHNKKLMNAYGPTETTVISNTHKYNNPEEVNWIGKALPNYTTYVLDNNLKLLPIGAIGELYIGGIGVARGYLNRPELTAEKFIANPYQTEQEKLSSYNSRLYKTGDLVRLLPNGCLEYIGRNDSQVKIRGFRIELGEIESAILGFENIKQAVAIVKTLGDSSSEHKSLICYYVADAEIDEKELKEYLSTCLPDYMLPNYFVYLKEIPLTLNGKLDKKALPTPKIRQDENFVPPRNELEKNICAIWESVLGLSKNSIGINNKFFSVGGDSIISIKIVNKIRNDLGVILNIKDIFTYNTVEKICDFIREKSSDFKPSKNNDFELNKEIEYKQIIELNKSSDKPSIFMIHSGTGSCDVYKDLSFKMKDHFHCYGVEHYNLYQEKMIDNFHDLCEYYLKHIQKIMDETKQKTYHLLGWSLGGIIALEIASILEKQGISNIYIYLLDSVYDNLQVLNNFIEIDVMDELIKNEVSPTEAKKIINTINVESKYFEQGISSKLKFAKTLLFKAMVSYKLTGNLNVDQYLKNCIDLKDNNIPNALSSPEQFKMIQAHNASHLSIIEKEDLIISEILKFIS